MADIVGFFWTKFIKVGVISWKVVSRRNGLSTLLMAILSIFWVYIKKEESSPKCYMDLLIIISDAIDYLKDPVWEEVGYSICKKI